LLKNRFAVRGCALPAREASLDRERIPVFGISFCEEPRDFPRFVLEPYSIYGYFDFDDPMKAHRLDQRFGPTSSISRFVPLDRQQP